MTLVRTSPLPAIERQTRALAQIAKIRVPSAGHTLTRKDALRLIQTYVDYYNTVRLHSGIDYVTPLDMLAGR
jgi:hypothetical protein